MKARLAKGADPTGRKLLALIVESDDGLLVTTVLLPPREAVQLGEQLALLGAELESGIIIPSVQVVKP